MASKWISVVLIAAIILGTALPLYRLYAPKRGIDAGAITGGAISLDLPDWAKRDAKTAQAYQLAATTHKEHFKFLTCHCGCGMHAMTHRGKTIPKMDNLGECFVRADGTWEDHAAMDCPYCVELAIMADEMLNKGYTLKQIREVIDTKYNQIPSSERAMDMNPPMPQ